MPLPESIQRFIDEQADSAPVRYDDLRAVVFNGTTKRSPEPSHTDGLWGIVRGIFAKVGVTVDEIRTADHEIPAGLWPDMREHGYERDEFPDIYERLVIARPHPDHRRADLARRSELAHPQDHRAVICILERRQRGGAMVLLRQGRRGDHNGK